MKIYFKHSTRCPVSAAAKREMDRFLEHNAGAIEFELVDVLSDRDRCDEIAEQFGVRHESPQIILVGADNKVLWTASHWDIREKKVTDAIREHS